MAEPATIALAGSTVLSSLSNIQAGKAAEAEARREASQYEDAATEAFGAGSRRAYLAGRQGERFLSDQRTAQAASGGTTTDPQAVRQRADAAEDVEFQAMNELFQGEVQRQERLKKARAARYRGRQAARQGLLSGISTAISGGGKAFQSYQAGKST